MQEVPIRSKKKSQSRPKSKAAQKQIKNHQHQGKKRTSPTEFQSRLYRVCKRIPRGKVATYGLLAKVVHSSARAVGQALRNNPYAPIVPCHRVVAATLDIGGFGGQWGQETENAKRKKAMLVEEGVGFDGFRVDGVGHLVDDSVLMCPDGQEEFQHNLNKR